VSSAELPCNSALPAHVKLGHYQARAEAGLTPVQEETELRKV